MSQSLQFSYEQQTAEFHGFQQDVEDHKQVIEELAYCVKLSKPKVTVLPMKVGIEGRVLLGVLGAQGFFVGPLRELIQIPIYSGTPSSRWLPALSRP